MVRQVGFEPTTSRLSVVCSTTELLAQWVRAAVGFPYFSRPFYRDLRSPGPFGDSGRVELLCSKVRSQTFRLSCALTRDGKLLLLRLHRCVGGLFFLSRSCLALERGNLQLHSVQLQAQRMHAQPRRVRVL